MIINSNLIKFTFLIISHISCTPKVYIIDRQTVLYESAAGDWPNFENSLLKQLKKSKPVPFINIPVSEQNKNKRLFSVIEGEVNEFSEEKQ